MSFTRRRVVWQDVNHILLRGFPPCTTAQDVRRLVLRADMRGVTEVATVYKHFRPTGKAVLTLSLPDHADPALRSVKRINLPGSVITAEAVENPSRLSIYKDAIPYQKQSTTDGNESTSQNLGNGPFGGVPEGKTVTISGFSGKTLLSQVLLLVNGFKTAQDRKSAVQVVPVPEKRFTLFSRFTVFLDSESEAQRFVRKYHMTRFKNIPEGPILKAFVIN